MRPVPIAPTLMRLLGENAPNTEAGTMEGQPPIAADAASPLPAVVMNTRRDRPFRHLSLIEPLWASTQIPNPNSQIPTVAIRSIWVKFARFGYSGMTFTHLLRTTRFGIWDLC